jgi:aminoglycoside phosphotransferase (APT) family kinase protein
MICRQDILRTRPLAVGGAHQDVPTPAFLADYLTKKLPSSGKCTVEKIVVLAGGRSKQTLLITMETAHPLLPRHWILRKDVACGPTNKRAADEFPVISCMYENKVPVAQALFFEEDPAPFNGTAIAVSKVDGACVGDYLPELSGPGHDNCLGDSLAQAIAGIHVADTGAFAPKGGEVTRDSLLAMIEAIDAHWRSFPHRASPLHRAAFSWLRMNADAGTGPAIFIHSDLGLHNTLVKNSAVTAIVDWEMAHIAHPAQDLGSVKHTIDHLTDWKRFVAAYRDRGGAAEACNPEAVDFYQIMIWTRNSLLATYCDHLVVSGATSDVVMTHAALDYHQRNTRLLALALAARNEL